jgi:hypothetical protein
VLFLLLPLHSSESFGMRPPQHLDQTTSFDMEQKIVVRRVERRRCLVIVSPGESSAHDRLKWKGVDVLREFLGSVERSSPKPRRNTSPVVVTDVAIMSSLRLRKSATGLAPISRFLDLEG